MFWIGKMDAKSIGLKDIKYFKGTTTISYSNISYMGAEYKYDAKLTAASNQSAFLKNVKDVGKAAFTDDMIAMTASGKYTLHLEELRIIL